MECRFSYIISLMCCQFDNNQNSIFLNNNFKAMNMNQFSVEGHLSYKFVYHQFCLPITKLHQSETNCLWFHNLKQEEIKKCFIVLLTISILFLSIQKYYLISKWFTVYRTKRYLKFDFNWSEIGSTSSPIGISISLQNNQLSNTKYWKLHFVVVFVLFRSRIV